MRRIWHRLLARLKATLYKPPQNKPDKDKPEKPDKPDKPPHPHSAVALGLTAGKPEPK